jgi:hypothetical protein
MNTYKEIFLNYENIKSETEEEFHYTKQLDFDTPKQTISPSNTQMAFTLSLPHFLIYG